jgi:hypothetical protein
MLKSQAQASQQKNDETTNKKNLPRIPNVRTRQNLARKRSLRVKKNNEKGTR